MREVHRYAQILTSIKNSAIPNDSTCIQETYSVIAIEKSQRQIRRTTRDSFLVIAGLLIHFPALAWLVSPSYHHAVLVKDPLLSLIRTIGATSRHLLEASIFSWNNTGHSGPNWFVQCHIHRGSRCVFCWVMYYFTDCISLQGLHLPCCIIANL